MSDNINGGDGEFGGDATSDSSKESVSSSDNFANSKNNFKDQSSKNNDSNNQPFPGYIPPPSSGPRKKEGVWKNVAMFLGGSLTGCLILPVIFIILMSVSIGTIGSFGSFKDLSEGSKQPTSLTPYVAVVRVNGMMITGGGTPNLFGDSGISGSETVVENIKAAADDKNAKAVILRINSPGGSPVAAEEITEAIKYAKSKNKPVYTSMADTAASAAYWIASNTDRIYAYKTTITGSIGVIMEGGDASELFDKIGYNPQTIKSGKYKDIGSLERPMTAEEKQLLQAMLDSTYKVFLETVAEGRGMSVDKVRSLADGRVYSGTQAFNKHLIDNIGSFEDCLKAAGKAAGMKGNPRAVEMGKKSVYDSLFLSDATFSSYIKFFISKTLFESADSKTGNLSLR